MIENWEISNQIDQAGSIRYTLLIDGTEQDVRLIARKLKGYVQDIQAANQNPYSYAFDLPADMDEPTQDKIRTAIREGVEASKKVNQFVPGGSLGSPLFTSTGPNTTKDFPTFVKPELSGHSLNNATNTTSNDRIRLDLSNVSQQHIGNATELLQAKVSMNDLPGNATVQHVTDQDSKLSTAAREVFATQHATAKPSPDDEFADLEFTPADDILPPDSAAASAPPASPAPKESTISISDQDMLLKDMEGSVLGKLPLEDILSAETKYDMFVDVQAETAAPLIQPIKNSKLQNAPGKNAFNVFESENTDTENLLDVAEVHAITERLPQKNMNFMKTPDTLEENLNSSADTLETDTLNTSSATPPQAPVAPHQSSVEGSLTATVPPVSPVDDNQLPDITVRGMETAQPAGPASADLRMQSSQEHASSRNSQPIPPTQPGSAQTHPHKTVLHLRPVHPENSNTHEQPHPAKTILRLRHKNTSSADAPTVTAPTLRSTRSPERAAENIRLAKMKAIDHSIEIPISELKKHNWPLEVPLVPTYTMNNMVMSVNRFAHATAISVIDNPGKLYNPLVLHGGPGTGKTHFLNALAYAFSQKFGQEHVFMTNGVRLSRGIQRYVMEGNISKFENFMDSVKVLLIDDIHLLAINEQNREFISKLLNSFLKNQKQIVITSKYPPESLEKLEELIHFRLDSGWISELKPATGATLLRIVKKMLIENGVDLNDKQIEEFFGGNHATLGTVMRSIRRLKVLENLLFKNLNQDSQSAASIFEKLLATKGEDATSELINKNPEEITSITTMSNREWGRIGFFYPQNCSNMMNWMVYALGQRAKELGIEGGFDIVVRSSYATENIISSAFKIANLCDNKKLKGAVILGPLPGSCDPSVRENFYDILTHMLEIMLIRCGIINYENVRLPSTYVKVLSELMR